MQALVEAPKVRKAKIARAPRNIVTRVEGTKLIIEVDMSVDLGPSSTGKSNLIATGTAKVPGFGDRASFGLNVWYR